MAQVIQWVVANWGLLAGLITGLLAVASIVTALTPTPKDDEVVRKIAAFLSFLQPRNSAGTLKLPGASPAPPVAPADDSEDEALPFRRLDDRE